LGNDNSVVTGVLEQSLVDIAIESWRFTRLFSRVLAKLDAGEASRYANQLRYFSKRLEDSLGAAGMRLINLEGHRYDPGMAATALNIADFAPDDELLVDQMVEPVIMGADNLVKAGTILLRKSEK